MVHPAERDALLARGDELWFELQSKLDASPDEALGPSTDWTGHDVFSHFARWQEQTIADLRRLLAGQAPQPLPGTEDKINARFRDEDRGVPTATLREQCNASRSELRAILSRLTEQQWNAFGAQSADDMTEAHLAPHIEMIGK